MAHASDIYVVPWMGIIINPLKQNDDDKKKNLLDSAYWSKRLSKFKPIEVNTFWVEQDSIVGVIAKFNNDRSGFRNAIELEKEFEYKGCSKKMWTMERREHKAYGWCAREKEDYNSQGPIGEYLAKEGKLRTVSDVHEEEQRNNLLEQLSNRIAMSNEVQYSYNERAMSLQRVLDERKAYADETKRMHEMSIRNIQRILHEKERLSNELDNKKLELQSRAEALDEMEASTELERQKLDQEKKKIDAMNISLQLASSEQEKAEESVLRLVEEHKRQKEEALNKMIQFEKQLNNKQTLELEIEDLKGKLKVMKHLGDDDDDDDEVVKQINDVLEEKKSELEELAQMNSVS